MRMWSLLLLSLTCGLLGLAAGEWASVEDLRQTCAGLWPDADPTVGNPLSVCQWNLRTINAFAAHKLQATGKGVRVGVMDSGVDLKHPDLPPNFDADNSCSFITTGTPTAHPDEMGDGDCKNKTRQRRAIQDLNGYGTHAVAMVGAGQNKTGIVGVAPEATVLALKVCTKDGMCFVDAVVKAIIYAGDLRLDVVVLNFFADPYMYLCQNEAAQRAIIQQFQAAVTYAKGRGVLIVAAAGGISNIQDLSRPVADSRSPDYPDGASELRYLKNNCRMAPIEFPGVLIVSASGPDGLTSLSNSGGHVGVTAPGGDFFPAWDFVDPDKSRLILGAWSGTGKEGFWAWLGSMGLTFVDPQDGARYAFTYMAASPHVAGVAALIKQKHPKLSADALASAVRRFARPMACPAEWPADDLRQCYGGAGQNSFYGAGMVDALGSTKEIPNAATVTGTGAAADPAPVTVTADAGACTSTALLIALACLLGAAAVLAAVSSVGWYRAARKTGDFSALHDPCYCARQEPKAASSEGDRLPFSPMQGHLTNTPMPLP